MPTPLAIQAFTARQPQRAVSLNLTAHKCIPKRMGRLLLFRGIDSPAASVPSGGVVPRRPTLTRLSGIRSR